MNPVTELRQIVIGELGRAYRHVLGLGSYNLGVNLLKQE